MPIDVMYGTQKEKESKVVDKKDFQKIGTTQIKNIIMAPHGQATVGTDPHLTE